MENQWFECKVKFDKNAEDGKIIKVNDSYLVNALSFTEAEARIIEEMKPYISGEFEVSNIKRVKIQELFENEQGGNWYRAKIELITFDDEKNIEKRTPLAYYVCASTIKDAHEGIVAGLKNTMADYEIVTLTKTAITDIFKYVVPEKKVSETTVD
ncbi:MAG: DUF4494 domain-containing protein [Paludibacter sp.]|jgi:hypothetical protein|nr:DUF4494 domain-containing protein [Paludibacter sp.]